VSSSFESGGRYRPVDVSVDDSDDIPLDGTRLKQERIERGISVNDAARMATLSREQIDQIENGGLRAFYGARHKRLAARKYADVFGINLAELLPEVPLASQDVSQSGESQPAPVMASAPPATEVSRGLMAQSSRPSNFESRRLPLVAVIVVALVLTFSILRGLTPTPRPVSEPIPEPLVESDPADASTPTAEQSVSTSPSTTAAPSAVSPVASSTPTTAASVPGDSAAEVTTTATTTTANKFEDGPDPCAVAAGSEIARWAPAQVRATYTRLYLGSYVDSTLCVIDATGAAKPIKLKAGGTTTHAGKPPYIIHSTQLPKLQIYLQGLKVKVPAGAVSIQLYTTQSLLPSEPDNKPAENNAQ